MTTIPNELIININTSIPGYQKIRYKPSMTIKNISSDDSKIRFDPLIKLSKSVIDKVPEDLRIKQFFNKGLFESLINFTNGHPAKNLNQATREGYVDNNIKLTLSTIFPDNSIIYVGGKPYVIGDLQWTNGSWKIDTKKKKEELDSSKISDPALYQAVVKDEIISGEQQLNTLNPTLVYGPNYSGPRPAPVASGIKQNTPPSTPPLNPPANPPPPSPTPIVNPSPTIVNPSPVPSSLVPIVPTSNTPSSSLVIPSKPTSSTGTNTDIILPPREDNLLPPIPPEPPEIIDIGTPNIPPPKKPLVPVIEPINSLKTSQRTTSFVKNVFLNRKFYSLINDLFRASDESVKKLITDTISKSVSVNLKPNTENLSLKAYNESVDEIKIIENDGGGNCFFIAVADAINYYNYNNQSSRIISGIYGTGNNLYTQMYLRTLVYDFIETWPELDSNLENIAPFNTENLNDIFKQTIDAIKIALRENGHPDDISNEKYIDIANDTFKENDNFLVAEVNSVPILIEDYYKPFKPITKSKLKDYILSSNYWANQIAIYAICEKLKVNVIPISIKKKKDEAIYNIDIPFGNFGTEYNSWKKYLFVYYYVGHFELMTFTYKTREIKFNANNEIIGTKFITDKKVIFDRSSSRSDLPPLYLLFSIYGYSYSSSNDETFKRNFQYQSDIMRILDSIINNILQKKPGYDTYYKNFKSFFPNSRIKSPDENPIDISQAVVNHTPFENNRRIQYGGAYARPYYNPQPQYYRPQPYYNPPPYYNPYGMPAYKIMKKDENKDDTQLAYYITIDLEVHPGTSVTPEEMKNLKCRQKWNNVRKAWSEFTGKPYVIPPVYQTKTLKNKQQNPINKTQYKRPVLQNNTRRYRPNPNYSGGKKNKTIKLN
jgi:hypothetical protein